ncbi:cutinase family protein [Streptomyces sp. DSM 44917]|uniref:Cutinase n=1 Tax=Streptomyces boetiae TaxID=3075541 RepID=A0ABU2L411_9ACTN|nr:cutinase family protein [Streptomyces sp. DSM 44917]MDT0306058.1 cutinase family protein [Streptomyces sp. DSM 44917]
MRIRTLSAVLAATALVSVATATSGTATAAAGAAVAAQDGDCPERMIFEAGGHLDPGARVYDASNATLPEGVEFTQIHYSASIWPYPGDPEPMDRSVAEGTATLLDAVREHHAACPATRLTISGYSQGAIVAGDALEALSRDEAIPHRQINGVLYGDPRRVGVNGGPGGIQGNLPGIIPGLTMQGERGFGDLRVRQYCNTNDGICHSENLLTNLVCFANGVVGYFEGDHDYVIDPYRHGGTGDVLIEQPPRIAACGPPLPIQLPTLWELFNGNARAAGRALDELREVLWPLLPEEIRAALHRLLPPEAAP